MRPILDLSGLIAWAGRKLWRARLDTCLAEHLGPAADQLSIHIAKVVDVVGPDWEGPLWGCAFEDLLGRHFAGQTLGDAYLTREGPFELVAAKTYMQALRDTPFALYTVGQVVPPEPRWC